jgi:phage pi2 protein 07
MQQSAITGKKYSLGTSIKKKLFDNFKHIVENPSTTDLKKIFQEDKFSFKFNNKGFGAYIDIPTNKEYFMDYYRNIGTPYIFGLYELDKANNTDILIGTVSLVLRYDNKVWQIMDLKIKKEYRGKQCIDSLISSTLTTRITKSTAYYAISMNPNPRIDSICNNMKLPKMKNRGKMIIYIVSFDDIIKILPTLQTFYCSEIGFINNDDERVFIDGNKKTTIKLLHLHHNANYREFNYREPQRGYQYCFAIHEDNDFIIRTLKDKYSIEYCSTANIFSNDFKTDWSKFVKTFEI